MSILALTSDTLIGTPATGNIEYNGQFFGTDSNASRAQLQRIVRATAVASTSGTSIDFTGIPAWVKRITVMFQGVSTSGTSNVQIQLGTGSTTYTTTGYLGGNTTAAGSLAQANATTGFVLGSGNQTAASVMHGQVFITNITGNSWVDTGSIFMSNTGAIHFTGGSIALAAALTAVRITTVNGTDTFDAGSINIMYEG